MDSQNSFPFGTVIFNDNELHQIDAQATSMLSGLGDITLTKMRGLMDQGELIFSQDHILKIYSVNIDGLTTIMTLNTSSYHPKQFVFLILNPLQNLFPSLLETVIDDLCLMDGNAVVRWVSQSWTKKHDVNSREVIGVSAADLEEQGIFRPSVALQVMRSGKREEIVQYNKKGERILASGTPIFDKNGKLIWIVSFSTWDIGNFLDLKEKYDRILVQNERYSVEVEKLRQINMEIPNVIAESPQMKQITSLIKLISNKDISVLITGKTGVGKSLIAKSIHQLSKRSSGPFVEINCGAISENLLESELFGYEGGAFTGANKKGKVGLIEIANNGTLFLDEIGEMSLPLQVKLLHTIQEKNIRRVGGTHSISVDFRLITATNKDLVAMIPENKFREDLFYRINGIPIDIPALCERRDDLQAMIVHFLQKANKKYGQERVLAPEVQQIMMAYNWPGNTRELENIIERIVVTASDDYITVNKLPVQLLPTLQNAPNRKYGLTEMLELYEQSIIESAYAQYKTTVGVSKALGISQPTATRKIKKYIK